MIEMLPVPPGAVILHWPHAHMIGIKRFPFRADAEARAKKTFGPDVDWWFTPDDPPITKRCAELYG